MNTAENIVVLGRTTARSDHRRFGIRQPDRLAHIYIIGKTGTGKTSLLETMMRQDIRDGQGFALLDPHGDLVERLAADNSDAKTIYLDVSDPAQPLGYNPLLRVSEGMRPMVASGLLDIFRKQWPDAWGVRMEHILRNALLLLLDQPKADLSDLPGLLTSAKTRRTMLGHVQNPQVKAFWSEEFPKYSWRNQADGVAPIQNKIGAFLADPRLRRLLTPQDDGLRLRRIMDEGGTLLVNLSQGKLGADSSSLFGALLLTSIGSAAFSRSSMRPHDRKPFFVYVDEFQNFTTLAVANMMAELRKFGVGMVLAHQYLAQLDADIQAAVLGNAGTLISFRIGGLDAPLVARELAPVFGATDLMALPNYHVAIKLMIDGAPGRPFSAQTLLEH